MSVLRPFARAAFLPLTSLAFLACGITLPEGMPAGDGGATADARPADVDATTDGGPAIDAAAADGDTPDGATDSGAGAVDSGSDTGPVDAGPVDSGPPQPPCSDADNEKQPILDASLARCNALTNATFLGVDFAPQFAVGTYCDAATAKRVVLCLFQPATPVSGNGLDGHCANAKIQEGAATFTANAYYRYVSTAAGSKTTDPDPAVRRLSATVGDAKRWARQSGGTGNGQVISLDKDGKVESPTPDKSILQMAACNFQLK